MNALRCKRSWISILLLGIVYCLALSAPVFSAPIASNKDPRQIDVMILIMPGAQGLDSVSISYPKLVSKATADADFKGLISTTGWSAVGETITNEGSGKGPQRPMTSVEFMAQHATDITSGVLKIEPIILAFKNLKNIQIIYFMPSSFQFHGLETYDSDKVKIDLSHNGDAYQYAVRIKRSDFEALNLPLEGKRPEQTPIKRSSNTAVIFIIAIIAAILVYIVTDRINRNSRRPSSRRS